MRLSLRPFLFQPLACLVLCVGASATARARTLVLPDTCTDCIVVTDTCCEAPPHIQDSALAGWSSHVLVSTRQPSGTFPYSVEMYDLNSPLPSGPEDVNWAGISRYEGPGGAWNGDSLGTVFGLTLDEYGNIFVCHTSCYNGDQIGGIFNSTAGSVYRIDASTGAAKVFVNLPNFPDGAFTAPENMPGLGNITYDCTHKQFFVTNMEDGSIYRIKPVGVNGVTGAVQQVFCPLGPDNGLPGFAPLGERLWAVQIHGNRVFYSVWVEDESTPSVAANEIRSVGLDAAGVILPGTDKHELYLPPCLTYLTTPPSSSPVSDISFSPAGRMLLAERSMNGATSSSAHDSRVLEYQCQNFCWARTNLYDVGDYYAHTNSAGGVDYDNGTAYVAGTANGRVWASGDALHLFGSYTDAIYGIQGFRPGGGTNVTSLLIDSDGITTYGDKTEHGDVEVPGCPTAPPVGKLCGEKFQDLNHNGIKDAGEPGLAGWTIVLTGPGGTYTAVTDASGNYCFQDVKPGNYTLYEVGQSGWVETAPAGGTYAVTFTAGVVQGGFDFGNYACNGGGTTGGGCVLPPTGMVAWWPFNETPGSPTAADVTHLSPSRNLAILSGTAAISAGGEVGNRICFPGDLDLAKVPAVSQAGLSFGTGSFAADAWIKLQAGTGGTRVLAEQRVLVSSSPYVTRGWAIYLNGTELMLEIGNGAAVQTVPGPVVVPAMWQHVAVSVDRVTHTGYWYLNGALNAAYNFVPLAGNITTSADLLMGHAGAGFQSTAFAGCIDELELFRTPLTAAAVAKLVQAGPNGKCPETCSVPQVTTICKSQTSVNVCFFVVNNTGVPQNYHWSLAGLPAGAGCTVAGPTSFSPPAGSITVPAGSWSGPICVNIARPVGLVATNQTACYAFSFVNDSTGACHTCTGTIRADFSCYCITPVNTGVVGIPGRLAAGITGIPISIGIGVGVPCDPIGIIHYTLTAVPTNTDQEDPLALALNGLPPGTPVTGSIDMSSGQDGQVTVLASYPSGYDPSATYEIVLSADTDGSGVAAPVCGTRVMAVYDTTEALVGVPPVAMPQDSWRLQAAPNPFSGGSTVSFSLARPDNVDVGVYDLGGRLVRSLHTGNLAGGPHAFAWDGHTDQGGHAPAGVYFARVQSARLNLQAKLVKLR